MKQHASQSSKPRIVLNGVEFHGNKLIVEEAKLPTSTTYRNNTFIKSSNLFEPLTSIPFPKPANPIRSNADQPPIQNVVNSYSYSIVPDKKDIVLFADSIPRGMKMEDMNSKIKGGRKNSPKIVSGC